MAKCALCGASTLLSCKIGTQLALVNSRTGLFPKYPYAQFGCDNAKVCMTCITNLRGLYNDDSIIVDPISNATYVQGCRNRLGEAKEYVSRYNDSVTDVGFRKFIDYSLNVADKILNSENVHVGANRERDKRTYEHIYDFIDQYKVQINDVIAKIQGARKLGKEDDYVYYKSDKYLVAAAVDLIAEDYRESLAKHLFASYGDYFEDDTPPVWIAGDNYQSDYELPDWMGFDLIVPMEYKIDDILYFCHDGDVQYASIVEGGGGGGGGVNLSGALLGGLMFGGVGAIIGSNVGTEIKIDPIKTTVQTIDSRKTLLVTCQYGKVVVHEHADSVYDVLVALIPDKERNAVLSKQHGSLAPAPEPVKQPAGGLKEQLSELKELLDMGIISQDEFDAKKKQLLGL